MEDQGFDRLACAVAEWRSRRAVLKALADDAAAGLLAALGGRGAGAANDKILICHRTGSATNPVVLIKVSVNAVPAHEAHGDAIDPDFSSDPAHCDGCFISCDDGDPCTTDTCVQGVCVNTPIVCDDGDLCTDDACVDGQCVFIPVEGEGCESPCLPFDACCPDEAACLARCCFPSVGRTTEHPHVHCDSGFFCCDVDCIFD